MTDGVLQLRESLMTGVWSLEDRLCSLQLSIDHRRNGLLDRVLREGGRERVSEKERAKKSQRASVCKRESGRERGRGHSHACSNRHHMHPTD
jgi:hypothetical protein